jgi:threonine dehydratase
MPRLTLTAIEAAREHIDPRFLDTPQVEADALGEALGARLLLKVETINPIRSFKGRGASLFVERDADGAPLVCASAGNFGQALAHAGRRRGVPVTVFASLAANELKVERMRALGADVHREGTDFDAAKAAARRFAEATRQTMVEDGRECATAEGAGTMALELLAATPELDDVVVPLGNGALLAGVATVVRALRPSVRIVSVQASGAPAMTESLLRGTFVEHERVDTIADGIAVRVPVREALDDLRGLVDEFVLVSDDAIVDAMRSLHRLAGLVAEPSGAIGVAALARYPERFRGRSVATIVCGSNLTDAQMREFLLEPARAR